MVKKFLHLLLALTLGSDLWGTGSVSYAADNNVEDAGDAISLVDSQVGAGKYDDGLNTIDGYLKKHPDFTQFYLQKGYVLLKLKRYDDSLVALNYCLKTGYAGIGQKGVDSMNAEVWMFIGHCRLAQGDTAGARQAFQKGLALYPDMENSLQLLKSMTAGSGLSGIAADRLVLLQKAKEVLAQK